MSTQNSRDSSERENWDRIFKVFVKALEKKEEQLESLAKILKILEDKIKSQDERLVSAYENCDDQISRKKNKIKKLKRMRMAEIAYFNHLLGMKKSDLSLCKSKLEQNPNEDDFKTLLDLLTLNKNVEICNPGDADECNSLELKIRKLKLDFEKLASGKRCKVSTLLHEAGFAWSRFEDIESGFTEKLMRKDDEIKQANKSNHEKDKIISGLKAKVAELEKKMQVKIRTTKSQAIKEVS